MDDVVPSHFYTTSHMHCQKADFAATQNLPFGRRHLERYILKELGQKLGGKTKTIPIVSQIADKEN